MLAVKIASDGIAVGNREFMGLSSVPRVNMLFEPQVLSCKILARELFEIRELSVRLPR